MGKAFSKLRKKKKSKSNETSEVTPDTTVIVYEIQRKQMMTYSLNDFYNQNEMFSENSKYWGLKKNNSKSDP